MHHVTSYLLTSEVSRLLNVSAQTVRSWERRGLIHAVKTDRGVRVFDRVDVERFAHERREDLDQFQKRR